MPFRAFVNLLAVNSEAGNFPFTSWHYRTKICIVTSYKLAVDYFFFDFLEPGINYTNIRSVCYGADTSADPARNRSTQIKLPPKRVQYKKVINKIVKGIF